MTAISSSTDTINDNDDSSSSISSVMLCDVLCGDDISISLLVVKVAMVIFTRSGWWSKDGTSANSGMSNG